MRQENCDACGGEGTGYCHGGHSGCDVELYVGGLLPLPPPPPATPSCQHHYDNGERYSGEYPITVAGKEIMVYCDMRHEGGGWTRVARGIGGDNNMAMLNAAAVNVDSSTMAPQSSGTYKLSDETINAIPKRSYWFRGLKTTMAGDQDWYWSADGCDYHSTEDATGACTMATYRDPEGKLSQCPGGVHGTHHGLSGWISGGAGCLHSAHTSSGWYMRQENCDACGGEGTGYCHGGHSGCDVELYVR